MVKVIKKKKTKSGTVNHSALNVMLAEATGFHQSGKLADAEVQYRKMISSDPNNPCTAAAHNNLANILKGRGDFNEAIDHYERAILLHPDTAETYYNLGNSFSAAGSLDEALRQYRKAISIRPGFAEAYNDLANTLKKQGKYDEAIDNYHNAILLNPDLAVAHNNLGDAYKEIGQFGEAVKHCQRAISLKPDNAELHVNFGNILLKQGSIQEAIAHYRKAVGLAPDYADAHYNKSLALLLNGEFKEGWEEYVWRFKSKEISSNIGFKGNDIPEWDGSPLYDKTILIKSEQGIGDSIQFIRYIPQVKSRCRNIIFECHEELMRLCEDFPGIDTLVKKPFKNSSDLCPDAIVHILSLPGIFKTDEPTISNDIPYISIGHDEVGKWKKRINSELFKIGIVWAGNSAHTNNRSRSIKLTDFAPLANVQGVAFLSLQKGDGYNEISNPPEGMHLTDLGIELADFYDTAAVILNLDLVISVDTAVVHLAGALGRPVWTLLPYDPDWRWMLDRDDSPWYPTMRLYRQPEPGNWQSVFSWILYDLKECVKKKRATI